jgi:ADP-heptose:LPS heptosyltransferase
LKTRKKVFFDRLLCVPVAVFLNFSARILGKTMGRDHSHEPASVRTIIVAKFAGMGSIVQCTPLLGALHQRFPSAKILFLTSEKNADLVGRLDHIHEIVVIDERNFASVFRSTLQALAKIVKLRADLYFDLEIYSAYASCMAILALTRNRYGFYRGSSVHKIGIYTHLVFFNTRVEIREIYLQLGLSAGCARPIEGKLGSIAIRDSDYREYERLEIPGAPLVILNPNASDLMIERRWPLENFQELALELKKSANLVTVGSASERNYVSALESVGVLNLAGKLSLGALLVLLKKCDLLVTNDTGPMHFAWALGTPTVSLFGPVDPKHYGMRAGNIRILYKPIYCSPCVHEVDEPPCGGNNVCMQRISVTEALDASLQLLRGEMSSTPEAARNESFFLSQDRRALGRIERASIEVF